MNGAVSEAGVREAAGPDVARIAEIYGHHVRTGLGTFEETAPDVTEMAARHAAVRAAGLPWLVADRHGEVAGYAYAAPFHRRSAYRFALEDSVYVAPSAQRQGIGRALLAALIVRCEALGYRQMFAVIGDSGNAGSIVLHENAEFRRVGTLRDVGFKYGRWVDTVMMQRSLASGGDTLPGATPLRS